MTHTAHDAAVTILTAKGVHPDVAAAVAAEIARQINSGDKYWVGDLIDQATVRNGLADDIRSGAAVRSGRLPQRAAIAGAIRAAAKAVDAERSS